MESILNVLVGGIFVSAILAVLLGVGILIRKLFKGKIEYSIGGVCLGILLGALTVVIMGTVMTAIITLIHDLNWLGNKLMT